MASSDDDDDVAYDGDALSTNENVIKCGMTTMEKVVRLRNKGITFKMFPFISKEQWKDFVAKRQCNKFKETPYHKLHHTSNYKTLKIYFLKPQMSQSTLDVLEVMDLGLHKGIVSKVRSAKERMMT
ncbi:hypothetical protein GLYMA_04G161101v4 [Glycine max]|nr:hypothetical protein GLYMA_04G161101v4 [Glycine max]KAH1111618.1 hypothetical protein GYH30_010126 [Glycine max]